MLSFALFTLTINIFDWVSRVLKHHNNKEHNFTLSDAPFTSSNQVLCALQMI